ncbi:MAG: prolipoprotein diacylglyceryl transferase [Verrucomicrobiales bacterium]|nr:prolipoprotein diacylglyceryl transferase [Verrucomicrobiales bacterium]
MSIPLATYVHHLDPFAIQFTETFGIRWYGLAYVGGFFAAFLLLRWFVKLGASELKEEQVGDFVTIVALLGTMLGGRLGYMLLYNFGELAANPLSFFDFLGGGMSSHGGIAGMCLAAWGYARYTKKSWLGLGDNLVVVAPLGVFFGRIANFINGELFGRPTESSWAMKFPDELHELKATPGGGRDWVFSTESLRELAAKGKDLVPDLGAKVDHAVSAAIASGQNAHFAVVDLITEASRENEGFRALLGEMLTPRHPSQLYEAVVEGLLPFAVLLLIRLKWKNLYHGIITGIFFIIYAIGRIAVENFREPDAEHIMGLTRGQFYSTFMIGIGIAFLAFAFVRKRRNQLPA